MNYKQILKISFTAFLAFLFIFTISNLSGLKTIYAGGNPSLGNDDDKPVEQVYKNIKVLNGMPKKDFITTMHFFRASLGVNCSFCHVHDDKTDTWVWESDDKEEKGTARKMIKMVQSINNENFEGLGAVSCFTCHQGKNNISRVPPVPQPILRNDEEGLDTTLPKGNVLVENYLKSLGDISKIEKSTSMYLKGTQTTGVPAEYQGMFPSGQIEIYMQSPDKYLQTVTGSNGNITRGFDGKTSWNKDPKGTSELEGFRHKQMTDFADYFSEVNLKTKYTGFQTVGKDTVNGKEVYLVRAKISKEKSDRLYFDVNTGLLLRRKELDKTMLGYIPYQTDYDDYRMTDGVMIPMHVHYTYINSWEDVDRVYSDVKFGVSLDNISFAMPGK